MNLLFDQQFSGVAVLQSMRPNVTRRTQCMTYLTRSMVFVLALWLFCAGDALMRSAPGEFSIAWRGQWAGSGTIDLSNGTREPIKCRASYDLLADQHRLQLNIRCASDSYNFDLFSSAVLAGRAVSGTWSESTRSVGRHHLRHCRRRPHSSARRESRLLRQFEPGHARQPPNGFDPNAGPECRHQGRHDQLAPPRLTTDGARERFIPPATGGIAARRYYARSC